MKPLKDTRSRILDVAEELFSEQGLDRVSIRAITRKAKVNLAAINYHFGSKEDLIAAVFERRVVPVNEARLAALDAVERAAGKKSSKLEAILEAFIRPALQCSLKAPKGGRLFQSCSDAAFPNQAPKWRRLEKQFEPLMEGWCGAMKRFRICLAQIFLGHEIYFGALHHWLLTKDKFLPAWVEEVDVERQTQNSFPRRRRFARRLILPNVHMNQLFPRHSRFAFLRRRWRLLLTLAGKKTPSHQRLRPLKFPS
jgi:AcrR family transcriptional regulator